MAAAMVAVAVSVAALLSYDGTDRVGPTVPDDVISWATGDIQGAPIVLQVPPPPPPPAATTTGDIQGAPIVLPDEIAATNSFAVDFYRQVSDGNGNVFFSPVSMYVAFSALYEGAREETADQIQRAFGLEPNLQERYNATAHLMSSINRDDPDATLEMANALWPAAWFSPYDSYADSIRSVYHADVERVDFLDEGDDGGVKRINAWAAEKTRGKIKEVIVQSAVNAGTAMVITNSLYFKGTWVTQFSEADTAERDFWKSPSESVMADFMMREGGTFDYASLDGVQLLRMPYEGGRLSMLVILPDDRDGMGSLEEAISAGQIGQWRQEMRPQKVDVLVPKFTTKTQYGLEKPLSSLGMTDVFDRNLADLSGIADVGPGRNLYVSSAFHDAYVDVNEQGTEAAAVTTMGFTSLSAPYPPPPPPPRFVADHPFIFIVQDDESGTILFMGRLSDPTV